MSFLSKIKDGCLASWENGILPSVSAAQAILESGWGESLLAQYPNHNLFSIKVSPDWKGKRVVIPTQEYVDGKFITVAATFRKYDSWEESIKDHALFFSENDWRQFHYQNVIGEEDYKIACLALQAAGYATDPNYGAKLISLIERNHLNTWDEGILSHKGEKTMGKHLIICGHGQGQTGYDPGATNPGLGITEVGKVREFASLMKRYSGNQIDYITEQNVYDYRSLGSIGKKGTRPLQNFILMPLMGKQKEPKYSFMRVIILMSWTRNSLVFLRVVLRIVGLRKWTGSIMPMLRQTVGITIVS